MRKWGKGVVVWCDLLSMVSVLLLGVDPVLGNGYKIQEENFVT